MRNSDILGDLLRATALLTRFPVKADFETRTAEAAWAYPLVGLLLGGIGALFGHFLISSGMPTGPSAALVLGLWIVLTGAMHEDGLADSADGLWGAWDRARRLEIMRDSHIGTYGVLAILLSVLIRWSAIAALLPMAPWALVVVPAASRAAMPALMFALPNARDSGLSQSTGRAPQWAALTACTIGAITAVFVTPLALLAIFAPMACGAIARAKIGGQTGDILGATQQITEIALWMILLVAFSGAP